MKIPLARLQHGPRAFQAVGLRAIVASAAIGRRYLQVPRAVDNGTVSNVAPLPTASISSGVSPTPGL